MNGIAAGSAATTTSDSIRLAAAFSIAASAIMAAGGHSCGGPHRGGVTTAVVTHVLTRGDSSSTSSSTPTEQTPPTPQYSSAEKAAAKTQICHAFDVSTSGLQDLGGVRIDGQPNQPLMFRALNSVVVVQTATTPAAEPSLAEVAGTYVQAMLEVTTAVTGTTPIEEVNRLNRLAADATYALADACGLPR